MIRSSRLPMFLALSVALVVGGMIPGHDARAQERPRYGGKLVFDPGQKTPEDTGEGWQIAAGHATYPQPPPAAAVRGAVGREARGGRAAWGAATSRGRLAKPASVRARLVPHPHPGACDG